MATSTRPAPPQATEERRSAEPPQSTEVSGRAFPVSLAVIVVPASLGLMRLLLGLHRPFSHAGDGAILETAVRRVATGTQTLGPYSRFGFHQLGPAYFYVQAPFSWLTGGSPRSLFIGALVINLGAAAACVAVVRRQLGEPVARWAAIVVAGYLLALTPALLADPWNPYVLGTPLLLAMLLAARAAAGSWSSAAGAAVVATFVVQTHFGAGLTVAGVAGSALLIAVAGRKLQRHRRTEPPGGAVRSNRRRWAAFGASVVLLALFWIPPVVEQVTHSPGNVTLLARFFRTSHPDFDATVDHSLATATGQVAGQLVTLPFGRPPDGDHGQPLRTAVAAGGLLVAAAVGLAGWRRRNLFVASLGGMSVVGGGAAIWSTTRVVGEVLPYLLVWCGVLLLPGWIGLGALLRTGPASTTPGVRRGVAVTAGVLGIALAWSQLRAPAPPVGDSPDVRTVTAMARRYLAAHDAGDVRVRIGEHDQWPLAAGLVNELDRDGGVTVDREWVSLFGDQFSPTGRESVELWVTGPAARPPNGRAERLGVLGGASLWGGPADTGRRP